RKVQRIAAYAQLEAINNQLKHLSDGKMIIASFDFGKSGLVKAMQPLTPSQLRVVTRDNNSAIENVFVQNKVTGDSVKIDLTGIDDLRVLTLGMDKGTSGMAIASFLSGTNTESCHTVSFSWDPYRRCARDMKLSMNMKVLCHIDQRSRVKTNLQRAQLASSSFLWSINYTPFGSAGFSQSKMELLEGFLALQDEECWSGGRRSPCCSDQLEEWWSLRMLLEHEFPHEPSVDKSDKSWARLRSESGGIKLALHCLSWTLEDMAFGERSLAWREAIVELGLARTISLAQGWLGDKQFKYLILVLSTTNFSKIGFYLEMASSLSKMNLPPDVYAGLLSDNEDVAQPSLDLLLSDWKSLVIIEQTQCNQTLAGDMRVSVPLVMRLVFQLSERGDHVRAKKLLRSLVHVLPDTKLIEDIHGRVRNDARMNINKKQSNFQIQQVINGSAALESRGVDHPAALNKDVFRRQWKRTNGKGKAKACFIPRSSKLPKVYSQLLGPMRWGTVSEESLHRSAAAWQLDARLAVILRPGMVFRRCMNLTAGGDSDDNDDNDSILLCVANLDWAVLAWLLVGRDDGKLQLDVNGQLEWHFVFRLDQWEAGLAEPLLDSEQIVIKEADFQPVVMCCLGCYSSGLVFRELVTVATFLGIKKPTSMSRNDLLRTIALSASGGNADFAESVVANEKRGRSESKTLRSRARKMRSLLKFCLKTWTRKMPLNSKRT
ncbi:unnamed protein product, partial [Cladocopium goreaui]